MSPFRDARLDVMPLVTVGSGVGSGCSTSGLAGDLAQEGNVRAGGDKPPCDLGDGDRRGRNGCGAGVACASVFMV